MSACHGNCNQGRRCDCAPLPKPIETERTTNMKKLLSDFIYYLRQGFSIRTRWRLANVTL